MWVRQNVLFRRFGTQVVLKKALGQHLLKDENVLRKLVKEAKIPEKGTVFEIGPGSGQLTKYLLQQCDHVVALEKDHDMVAVLQQRFQQEIRDSKLTLLEGDVLKDPLPAFDVCVANIPYYVSSQLIQRLILSRHFTEEYLFLVQKEFCDKLIMDTRASNHDSTFLTVLVQSYFRASKCFDVSKTCFVPPPKVTSSVLSLSPLYAKEGEDAVSTKPEEYAQFLRTLFRTKNKSFVKVLQTAYGKCADCNIDPKRKVYQLSSEEYKA
ncbi:hypothetical protein WA577_002250, partial [Blastocystis sp. JDR]